MVGRQEQGVSRTCNRFRGVDVTRSQQFEPRVSPGTIRQLPPERTQKFARIFVRTLATRLVIQSRILRMITSGEVMCPHLMARTEPFSLIRVSQPPHVPVSTSLCFQSFIHVHLTDN